MPLEKVLWRQGLQYASCFISAVSAKEKGQRKCAKLVLANASAILTGYCQQGTLSSLYPPEFDVFRRRISQTDMLVCTGMDKYYDSLCYVKWNCFEQSHLFRPNVEGLATCSRFGFVFLTKAARFCFESVISPEHFIRSWMNHLRCPHQRSLEWYQACPFTSGAAAKPRVSGLSSSIFLHFINIIHAH